MIPASQAPKPPKVKAKISKIFSGMRQTLLLALDLSIP
ncbi:guanosine 5'-monophosphate oxidoreductase [Streptococcus pneumoniae SP11-BS70]|nr:guanosine 5'-monophosphate oxidoreductase [Streptococcus pneumoniae SP11-BS70]EDK76337.1 guanosine 5'-monophosphate oxidoreductase [Streptococcus pneumoniae SP6-BS73]